MVTLTKENFYVNEGGNVCDVKLKKNITDRADEWSLGLPFLKQRCVLLDFNGKIAFPLQEDD